MPRATRERTVRKIAFCLVASMVWATTACGSNPEDYSAVQLADMGHSALRDGKTKEALTFFEQSLGKDPTHGPAIAGKARVLRAEGRASAAFETLTRCEHRACVEARREMVTEATKAAKGDAWSASTASDYLAALQATEGRMCGAWKAIDFMDDLQKEDARRAAQLRTTLEVFIDSFAPEPSSNPAQARLEGHEALHQAGKHAANADSCEEAGKLARRAHADINQVYRIAGVPGMADRADAEADVRGNIFWAALLRERLDPGREGSGS